LSAENGIFEADLHPGLNIVATIGSLPSTCLPAPEKATKNIAQAEVTEVKVDVLPLSTETLETFEWITVSATVAPDTGVAELVIALPLLGIFQYFVSLIDLFELCLVPTLFIGVELHGFTPEGFLDFIGTSVFGYAQNFIIITFCHTGTILALKGGEC
jgi:hypothetical protein